MKTKKNRKTKEEVKRELLKPLVKGEKYENDAPNGGTNNAKSYQETITILQESEKTIQRQKINILSAAYRQGRMFKRFMDNNNFLIC